MATVGIKGLKIELKIPSPDITQTPYLTSHLLSVDNPCTAYADWWKNSLTCHSATSVTKFSQLSYS